MANMLERRLKQFRADAADCRLVSELAAEAHTRKIFARFAVHLNNLADELAQAKALEDAAVKLEG